MPNPPTRRRPRCRRGLLLVAALPLSVMSVVGCARAPVATDPPVAVPEAFSSPGSVPLSDRWWTAFDDARLDSAVASALRDNLDLRSAWERIGEAAATARIAGASRYPTLDAFADGQIARPAADPDGTLDLGLAASYELDLFGRIGAAAMAAERRAAATAADYRTTAITLSAEVARTWYQLAEARAAADLVAAQIATNARTLAALEARFGTGLVRRTDILRQQRLLEETRERALTITATIGVLEHRLAILLGRAPAALPDPATAGLPDLPPPPATGVPGDLVQRRPDVQAAFLRLQAADADLAAAVASRYPRLSLTARVSTSSAGADELFDDWLRSLAGNLLAPLFRGGELSADVDRNEARRQQALYAYGQAVLEAIGEVEDALLRERLQRERIESLAVQVDFAEQAHRRLRLEFLNGAADFLDVLTALGDQQRLERDLLAARLVLIEDRIALYRALAGGFETDPPDRGADEG